MKIRTRMFMYLSFLSIIPLLLSLVIVYAVFFKTVRDKSLLFSRQAMEQSRLELDTLFLNIRRIGLLVANDPAIQERLRSPLEADIGKRFAAELELDTQLNLMQNYTTEEIFGIYVVGLNGAAFKSNYATLRDRNVQVERFFLESVAADGPRWFGPLAGSALVRTVEEPYLMMGLPVVDKHSGQVSGAVFVDMKTSSLRKKGSTLRLGESGYLFILDTAGVVLLHSDPSAVGGRDGVLPGDRAALRLSLRLDSGWSLEGIIPIKDLLRDSLALVPAVLGVVLGAALLSLIAAFELSKAVSAPLMRLLGTMKRVEAGDLGARSDIGTDDEIGALGAGFNHMVEELASLLDKIRAEQSELALAKYRILQAQINPHFLYNTLDSIIWLSRAGKNAQLEEMTMALTRLFRVSLSKGRDIISLKEELEHVRNYLVIQHLRYADKFDYSLELPPRLEGVRIPKMVLQPLVENSIYHGIKNKRGKGLITVCASEADGFIDLAVADTGVGMTPARLRELEAFLESEDAQDMDTESGYGIRNVHKRVRICYGADCGLRFGGAYGEGTVAVLRIGKTMEESRHD